MWIKTEDRTPTIPDMPEDYVASQEFQVFVPGRGQMVAQFFKTGGDPNGHWRSKSGEAIEPTHWTYLMRGPNEQQKIADSMEVGEEGFDLSNWTPRGLQRCVTEEFGKGIRASNEIEGCKELLSVIQGELYRREDLKLRCVGVSGRHLRTDFRHVRRKTDLTEMPKGPKIVKVTEEEVA